MSRKGNPYDNSKAERLFGTIKYEGLHLYEYETFDELNALIKEFIEDYNHQRLHSSIGYKLPSEFEKNNAVQPKVRRG